MSAKQTTAATFAQDVLASEKPVLVDFWAAWCGPCRTLAPVLDEVAAENEDKLAVYKVNVDENPQLAAAFQIRGIPALLVFKGGQVAKQFSGAMPKQTLERQLVEFLK